MRAIVTGGAGFLGSHWCRRLIQEGWEVTCLDTFLTGSRSNLQGIESSGRFRLVEMDVTKPISVDGDVDWVMHFASLASPQDYLAHPIHTMKVGGLGTLNALGLAKDRGASFLLASTSEVYGDPKVHPQPESYWGNVNPIGPRSVYDEAKRYAEALTSAYHRVHGVSIRIARIFNTYGPAMRRGDGRAVPTFVEQALAGKPLTVHGEGTQTRSLCFVDDLIDAFWRLARTDIQTPINLGNPEEVTVLELAETIRDLAGSASHIRFVDRPVDDPENRNPDISRAKAELGWEPVVPLREGLAQTIEWARTSWGVTSSA